MVILAALFCLFFAFFLRPINWMTVNPHRTLETLEILADNILTPVGLGRRAKKKQRQQRQRQQRQFDENQQNMAF